MEIQDYELDALLKTDEFDYTEEQIDTIRRVLEDYEPDDPEDPQNDYTNAVIAVTVGDDTIEELGDRLAKAREAEARALSQVMAAVRVEAERGMSEYDMAEKAGVARSTVRAWLGK